jgi:methionyl-tRNA formyltransferase
MRFGIYVKGERGIQSLVGLYARKLIPCICVSEKDESEICSFCREHQIPYIVDSHPGRKEAEDAVRRQDPELIVCAGYSKILPEELFANLRYGAINCHGGRLPQYRGASPIPWQIINGETYGVAYILKMTRGIDDGPILAQERYEIAAEDTARHVTDKVTRIFNHLVPDVVEQYAKGSPPAGEMQTEKDACHWTRRYPGDGRIHWNRMTVRQVVNFVRALDDPYPGAFVERDGSRLVIRRARAHERKMGGIPGRFVGKSAKGALILASEGAVEVLEFIVDGQILPGTEFPAKYGETF